MLLYSFINNPLPSLPTRILPLSKSSQQLFINSLSSNNNSNNTSTSTKRKLNDDNSGNNNNNAFVTAKRQYIINQKNNNNNNNSNDNDNLQDNNNSYMYRGMNSNNSYNSNNNRGKCLGGRRILRSNNNNNNYNSNSNYNYQNQQSDGDIKNVFTDEEIELLTKRNVDIKMAETIQNEVVDDQKPVTWNDIAGLEKVKSSIKEAVVYPLIRPDIFTGLRKPPKGILLFGPPGTGKTLIGKAIAHQCGATFYSISASSLTSKWIGEGEKMVKTLFIVAGVKSPSVIFIDEIDSILTKRNDKDEESTRRMKTEFLVQLDGVRDESDDCKVLLIGATNRPQDLDEAILRRFVKKLYIPLPDKTARKYLLQKLLSENESDISENEYEILSERSEFYSCADINSLCRDASLGPIREQHDLENLCLNDLRAINYNDVLNAFKSVKPTLNEEGIKAYDKLNKSYNDKDENA